MDTRHKRILERMADMQSGLIRYSSHGQKVSLTVNVLDCSSPSTVQFSVLDKCRERLVNKRASVSQVATNGYLFLSGTITSEDSTSNLLCMHISKAHWFEIKDKGGSSLEEITFYG